MKISVNWLKKHSLVLFWICLMASTYIGYSEELIIGCVLLFLLMRKRVTVGFIKRKSMLVIFFSYCFFTTLLGVMFGFTEVIAIAKFFVEYVLLVFCVSSALFYDKTSGITSLIDIRNLICVSAIYGTVETIMGYNPLANYVTTVNWLDGMNNLIYRYQCSSIYLHYTYYAFFLLTGLVILFKFPFEKKLINISAYILLLEQLFFTKSRMGWITFVIMLVWSLIKSVSRTHGIKKNFVLT